MKNSLFPLFAYPVVICGEQYEFSETEKDFISSLDMRDNVGNTMSNNDRVLDAPELSDLKQFIDRNVFIYKNFHTTCSIGAICSSASDAA